MLEILAPAGNAECAAAAINNGANAIYLGLDAFSARQSAGNFDETAFRAVLQKAHLCGVNVYVAMNTLIKDKEIAAFLEALLFAWNEGADAIILQDVFLGKLIHEKYPDIILHLSTQAGVCTLEGAKFAKECGFSRVILARETPFAEIAKIAQFIETEVFVQGALCTCFSGQCYFSSFAGGNSGNRGRCKQPCRKLYSYDRNGNTEKNYALSLSDLSVGEGIEKLISVGVCSFKIEGRMRRAEYVGAAVRYYRSLLDSQGNAQALLSDLKRSYNRGNYTKGLAFGQDKRFLSLAVQGHLGEKVGVVKVINGKYYVESSFKGRQGDAFKILRDGKEICGAVYLKTEGRAFIINSKIRLKNGDGVFVTTDTAVNERVLAAEKKQSVSLGLQFEEGKAPVVSCGEYVYRGSAPLETAQNRPLSEEELRACFMRTDGLPICIIFDKIQVLGNIFITKSQLNAIRRDFYKGFSLWLTKKTNTQYAFSPLEIVTFQGKNDKTAVIAADFTNVSVDIAIYKADDLSLPLQSAFLDGSFEKYLYYPSFATREDLLLLEKHISTGKIDGIYTENYGGILYAQTHNLKIFAGTGLNLFNRYSIQAFLSLPNAVYYAISKELNMEEGNALKSSQSFALASGNLKIMDLCYCPFGKTCSVCDQRNSYMLTDENGREFPVRRYIAGNGDCRFEVYNCAELVGTGIKGSGKLLDLSLVSKKQEAICAQEDETAQKSIYKGYTSGHYKRGVL